MTMPIPIPGQQPQVRVPAARTRVITCCGYVCSQGVAAPWECPGCKTVHPWPETPEAPAQ